MSTKNKANKTNGIKKAKQKQPPQRKHPNVYQTCNDEFVSGKLIKDEFFTKSHKGVKVQDDKITVDLDEFEGKIHDMYDHMGTIYSADEVLATSARLLVQLPYKDRAEFGEPKLPDSELLKVLHYYTSHRTENQNLHIKERLDDTALLSLGILMEKWADDMITKDTASMFIENYENYSEEDNEDEIDDHSNNDSEQEQDDIHSDLDSEHSDQSNHSMVDQLYDQNDFSE